MGKPSWTIRPEQWLEKMVDDYMKKHPKTDRTKAIHNIFRDLKQQNDESAKEIKRLREEARHYRKKAEKAEKLAVKALPKQKAGSTSQPQKQKQYRLVPGWAERVSAPMTSGGGMGCPFQKELVYKQDCKKCKKNTPSKHQQCAKVKEPLFSRSP